MDVQTGILSQQLVNATGVSHDIFCNTSIEVCKTRSKKNRRLLIFHSHQNKQEIITDLPFISALLKTLFVVKKIFLCIILKIYSTRR